MKLSPLLVSVPTLLLSSVPEMDPDWLTNLLAKRAQGKTPERAAVHTG